MATPSRLRKTRRAVRRRFTDAQILGLLREAEAGTPLMDLCWNHCISRSTFRAWEAKFGAASDVKTDRLEGTGVPGLYVAGDASRDVQLAIVAAAEGARAAFAMNVVMQEEEGLGPDPPRRIAKPARSPDIRIRGNPGGDRR